LVKSIAVEIGGLNTQAISKWSINLHVKRYRKLCNWQNANSDFKNDMLIYCLMLC